MNLSKISTLLISWLRVNVEYSEYCKRLGKKPIIDRESVIEYLNDCEEYLFKLGEREMPFDTQLNKENEKRFNNWLKAESNRRGRDISKDVEDYDLRGYWLNGGYKDKTGQRHMPDTYKKPNHPTFSNESKYHDGKNYVGGRWEGDSVFVAGKTNLKTHGEQGLRQYLQKVEPNVKLKIQRL